MKRRFIVLSLVSLLCAVPVFAILGLGDIVYDPTNFEEAVQELAQLEQQYRQSVQTYQMVQNQYQQMLRMAQQLPSSVLTRYRRVSAPWTVYAAPDAFGNTAEWTNATNSGSGIASGYAAATAPLGSYNDVSGQIPTDQMNGIKSGYATVELTDAANLSALQTIGQIRGNSPSAEAAIGSLENDSLSENPDLNTEIAVLNKINAAGVIHLRATQDTNQLLVALAEQNVVASKRVRDAEAQAFNEHIAFTRGAQNAMTAQAAGASDAMTAYRMP